MGVDPPGAVTDDLLFSNYPNPFRNSTTITFTLKRTEKVTLSICDRMGSWSCVLPDRELQQGTHRVLFSAEKLPGGLYLGRLTSTGISAVIKMIRLE
jgi:hypothetical protein